MAETSKPFEVPKFSTPEEEIEFLRAKVLEQEKKYLETFTGVERENVIREEVRRYAKANPDEVLEKGYAMLHTVAQEITLELSPETHDKKMEEVLAILSEKGIKNALEVLRLIQNPHLEDDFHRFLIQYIKAGLPFSDLNKKERTVKALKHTLFEVALPSKKEDEKDKQKELKELISGMEQFYAGMLSSSIDADESFSIEIANPEGSEEAIFYVSVPDKMAVLFEKHILSVFPKAKIFEKKDDYNIFNYDGSAVAMQAHISGNPIMPLKTYDKFDFDPLKILLNAFSKIDKDGEGAAIQVVLRPDHENYLLDYKEALRELERGERPNKALDVKHSFLGQFGKTLKGFGREAIDEYL